MQASVFDFAEIEQHPSCQPVSGPDEAREVSEQLMVGESAWILHLFGISRRFSSSSSPHDRAFAGSRDARSDFEWKARGPRCKTPWWRSLAEIRDRARALPAELVKHEMANAIFF